MSYYVAVTPTLYFPESTLGHKVVININDYMASLLVCVVDYVGRHGGKLQEKQRMILMVTVLSAKN